MAELIVGIDLGTTNSEVAYILDGKPVVITDENDDPILPSYVGIAENGKLLVGKAARNQYPLAPERTIKSIKRKMGQDVKVALGDKQLTPQEVSALILKALKERAEAKLGQPVKKAVVTVPAYFNDAQRQATREAGEIAGLDVVRILNEPTAASLAYDPQHSSLQRILVYDLGGGTFDVSIVQAQDGVIEVLSSHGDTHLGGDDFDDLLLKHLMSKFQMEHGVDLSENVLARARLLRASEEAKKKLSFHPFARIDEEFLAEKDGQALHMSLEVSRSEYEDLVYAHLERTMDSVRKALEDAKLTPADIDRVVLVGGSTRTPMVTALLEQQLGKTPRQDVNPDLCVAMGAAIQGGLVAGIDVGAVLVDITPHSLGIKALSRFHGFEQEFVFARILHRTTALPATRSEAFFTVSDNQATVDIEVYQGESDDVRLNHRIGKFSIDGLAKVPAGNTLTVQFDLNLDGILKVTAREKATGHQKDVSIDGALKPLGADQIRAARDRIREMWGSGDDDAEPPLGTFPGDAFPMDDDVEDGQAPAAAPFPELVAGPAEGQRETVQARALVEKAERLLPSLRAEDQTEIRKLNDRIRAALADGKWDVVASASNSLSDLMFYLEDA